MASGMYSASIFSSPSTRAKKAGIINRRRTLTIYTFLSESSFFTLYVPMVKPVSSIASGAMQLPVLLRTVVTKLGRGRASIPRSMPSTSEMHTGLMRFFRGFLCSPPEGISMTMPQL